MAKLATRPKAAPKAAIKTKKGRKPDTLTENAGAGFSREPKSELFLLAVTNMVSEKTFYEGAVDRDQRFAKLVRQVALEDPDWIARFVPYLRDTMNMRSASIVMAAELVHTKLTQPVPASTISNRTIIDSAIKRADEPAEMIGYWMSQWGKNLPQPVKRGVSDAVGRVYNEWSLIKYDGGDKAIRFGDVVELVHAVPAKPFQGALYKFAIDSRHNRDLVFAEDGSYGAPETWTQESDRVRSYGLPTLRLNRLAMALPDDHFRAAFSPTFVENAGLTWEQASSKYGKLDAKFWEAMIPSMGIFAIVRNLRNFEDAAISKEAQALVRARLEDEDGIRKSRMFPLRFLAAYTATNSLTFARELEEAIRVSVSNVPVLTGKTLVLVDISGSMDAAMSDKSKVNRLAIASVFGASLAVRGEDTTLVAFSDQTAIIPTRKTDSVLRLSLDIAKSMNHGGTQTWQAVQQHLSGHDRVVILTDEQADFGYREGIIPDGVRLYTFNVAGYRAGHAPSGKKGRYAFGGLTDAAFTAIELLEKGHDQSWPF